MMVDNEKRIGNDENKERSDKDDVFVKRAEDFLKTVEEMVQNVRDENYNDGSTRFAFRRLRHYAWV